MRKYKDINDCKQYKDSLKKQDDKFNILFPLMRSLTYSYSPYLCPNCSSNVIVEGKFLGIARTIIRNSGEIGLGFLYSDKKHYCLNRDCVYHYFEVASDSENFHGDAKKIVEFVESKIKE